MINLHNIDCMEFMAGLPDKAFDLAIVDPPYGIGQDGRNGSKAKKAIHNWRTWDHRGWDGDIPPPEYFEELRRVSWNQIVWGANYMTTHLAHSRCWLFWDKGQDLTMPDGELAWTSFDMPIRRKVFNRCAAREDGLIHPTQKPVALYRWLLQNYAKPGDKILDTHGGSMSSAIAADIEGFDLDLCELDRDYFEAGKKRLEQHRSQPRLFSQDAPPEPEQLRIDNADHA
jgi:site-specific DNA-methyltransferase (adenine-specific)